MPDVYWVHLSDGNFEQAYRFIGGPIEDPAAFPELFQALGLAAAAWARMEQHVDAILLQINKAEHSSDTLDLYDEQHPKPFTGKIKMLRDYFNKHPALARYMDTIREFANGLMKLSDDRNEWIHGMIEGYDPKARIVTLFKTTYREKTNDFLHRKAEIPLERIEHFAKLVNIGHYGLCEVSKELFTPDALERLKTP